MATSALGTVVTAADAGIEVTAVSGTASLGSVTIYAKAVVLPTGVTAAVITDDPLINGDEIVVDAEAVIIPSNSGGISFIGVPSITANANVIPTGIEAEGDTEGVTVEATAITAVTGIAGTLVTGTVNATAEAVSIASSVAGSVSVDVLSITAVQLDYEAVKENYSRGRTEYISAIGNVTRTVFVESGSNRFTYIEPQATTRTVFVESGSNRVAYVEPQATTRKDYAIAA